MININMVSNLDVLVEAPRLLSSANPDHQVAVLLKQNEGYYLDNPAVNKGDFPNSTEKLQFIRRFQPNSSAGEAFDQFWIAAHKICRSTCFWAVAMSTIVLLLCDETSS